MTQHLRISGGPIFDGHRLREAHEARFEDGRLIAIAPESGAPDLDLAGDILAPGYVDLQVNGGGGVLLNDAPTPATLARIAEAHRALGTRALLPTLITDRAEVTDAAIAAAIAALEAGADGIAGLHLEGPHLAPARKGAHDDTLIRPMTEADLEVLCAAARHLPCLMVTLAPESVTLPQVRALTAAGIRVALGHSDADFETCRAYAAAGAHLATHLFNAMSPMTSRAPGLVGAVLDTGRLSSGVIADGHHVHPATLRCAFAAKRGPGRLFLVSDAMAVAGTDLPGFTLNGREIRREDGRLTLADGTLAGADLDLTRALQVLVDLVGLPLDTALEAAITTPAELIGLPVQPAALSDFIRIRRDLSGCAPLS